MVRDRAVIHINIADFAARVEACLTPSLGDRPLIIAPEGAPRARVFDMNEAAFQEGVRKGMPLARAQRLHPRIPVLPPRLRKYSQVMTALFRQAAELSPQVESGGTDGHLYLDITGTSRLYGPPPDVAWRLKQRIEKQMNLSPIWTLAPNRLVAKAASRVVKPTGEYIVGPGEEEAFLAPLPIALMPGLTPAERRLLLRFNIASVSQARTLTLAQLAVPFDGRASLIHDLLLGIDNRPVGGQGRRTGAGPENRDEFIEGPSPLRAEHEFADDTNDTGCLKAGLALMIARLCGQLRRRGKIAARLALTLTYTDTLICTRSMKAATADESELLKQAWDLLLTAWTRRIRIRHMVLFCIPRVSAPVEVSLFGPRNISPPPPTHLHRAMDSIRARFGPLAVQSGAALGLGSLPAQAARAEGAAPCS